MWLPVIRTWRLNERHYGALTGLNKAETAAKHGEAQVKIWRRSYDIPPPPMQSDHPFYSTIAKVRPIALCLAKSLLKVTCNVAWLSLEDLVCLCCIIWGCCAWWC